MVGETEVFRGANGRYLAARWHELIVLFYVGEDDPANIDAFADWSRQQGRALPGGSVTIVWIDEWGARHLPDARVRDRYAEIAKANYVGAMARSYLVECDGFAGATVRAVLTGMAVLRSDGVTTRVSRTPEEALGQLFEVLGKRTGAVRSVTDALAFLRPLHTASLATRR